MPSPEAKNKHTTTAIPAYLRRGGCLLMLAVAVAAPLAGVQFGALDPCDESYQRCASAPTHASPQPRPYSPQGICGNGCSGTTH